MGPKNLDVILKGICFFHYLSKEDNNFKNKCAFLFVF